jgi:hypothetical protein
MRLTCASANDTPGTPAARRTQLIRVLVTRLRPGERGNLVAAVAGQLHMWASSASSPRVASWLTFVLAHADDGRDLRISVVEHVVQ